MRKALKRVLVASGMTPEMYASAETAIAGGSLARAGCLVLDIHLPGLSGLELCERLARQGPLPPVVFITAYDDPRLREAAHRFGALAFLAKPFSGRDLAAIVKQALSNVAAGQENGGVAP